MQVDLSAHEGQCAVVIFLDASTGGHYDDNLGPTHGISDQCHNAIIPKVFFHFTVGLLMKWARRIDRVPGFGRLRVDFAFGRQASSFLCGGKISELF